MNDSISNSLPPTNRQQRPTTVEGKAAIAPQSVSVEAESQLNARAAAQTDSVKLSELAEKALNNAEFDQEKTTRIKEAIEQGNCPLDHKRIAESFIALEQLIGDN